MCVCERGGEEGAEGRVKRKLGYGMVSGRRTKEIGHLGIIRKTFGMKWTWWDVVVAMNGGRADSDVSQQRTYRREAGRRVASEGLNK